MATYGYVSGQDQPRDQAASAGGIASDTDAQTLDIFEPHALQFQRG